MLYPSPRPKFCQFCGGSLPPPKLDKGRTLLYCKDACRKNAQRKRERAHIKRDISDSTETLNVEKFVTPADFRKAHGKRLEQLIEDVARGKVEIVGIS